MKTTIDISDELLKQAKLVAEERRTTLRAVLEEALRDALAARNQVSEKHRLAIHIFEGKGLKPGLSWDDWGTLRSMGYEGRGG